MIIFYRHIENKHPEKLKGKSNHKRPNPFSDDEMSSPMKTRTTRSSARLTGAVDDTDEDDLSEVEGLSKSFTEEHYLNLTGMEKEYKVIRLIFYFQITIIFFNILFSNHDNLFSYSSRAFCI